MMWGDKRREFRGDWIVWFWNEDDVVAGVGLCGGCVCFPRAGLIDAG